MVLLRGIEYLERLHLGHDRIIPHALGLQFRDDPLRHGFLLGAVVEDRRAILRADVPPLAVQGRGVVDREKDVQQVVERDDRGIEGDLQDFGVAGRPGADLLVRRVGDVPARIA